MQSAFFKILQQRRKRVPENIDYTFLSELEGGSKTRGYVPAASVSKSGVTISTGFDLGQRNESDLKRLKLNANLIAKLKPYLGLKGKDAQDLIKKMPLLITLVDAQEIDKAVKAAHISQIKLKYDSATTLPIASFFELIIKK